MDESLKSHGVRAGRRVRIRSSKDFERAFRSGKRRSAGFLALALTENELGKARLGLVVSRKVGNAVARNRIKRALREGFRLNPGAFAEGRDYIFTARPGIAEIETREIWGAMESLARRAGRALEGEN